MTIDHNFFPSITNNEEQASFQTNEDIPPQEKSSKRLKSIAQSKIQMTALVVFAVVTMGLLSVMALVRISTDPRQQASVGTYTCQVKGGRCVVNGNDCRNMNGITTTDSCSNSFVCCKITSNPTSSLSPTPNISPLPTNMTTPGPQKDIKKCPGPQDCVYYVP